MVAVGLTAGAVEDGAVAAACHRRRGDVVVEELAPLHQHQGVATGKERGRWKSCLDTLWHVDSLIA